MRTPTRSTRRSRIASPSTRRRSLGSRFARKGESRVGRSVGSELGGVDRCCAQRGSGGSGLGGARCWGRGGAVGGGGEGGRRWWGGGGPGGGGGRRGARGGGAGGRGWGGWEVAGGVDGGARR